jgi:hypothetical protein
MTYSTTCRLTKRTLVGALADTMATGRSLIEPGYTDTLRQNIVPEVSDAALARIIEDLSHGDGAELTADDQGRAKACAAYSSCALAVNTFGGWQGERLRSLRLLGEEGFSRLRFEAKFPTGMRGKSPNLDLVAERGRSLIAVESKCLEYLTPKPPEFRDSYAAQFEEIASPTWLSRFKATARVPQEASPLDAAQLLRHYLGLKHAIVRGSAQYESATLLYLYWEPTNATDFPEFAAHRRAIDEFAAGLEDPHVGFASQSYPELWATWRPGASAWLAALLAQLDGRYSVSLAGSHQT